MAIKIEIEVINNTKISKDNHFSIINSRHHHKINTISIKNYSVTIITKIPTIPSITITITITTIMIMIINTNSTTINNK